MPSLLSYLAVQPWGRFFGGGGGRIYAAVGSGSTTTSCEDGSAGAMAADSDCVTAASVDGWVVAGSDEGSLSLVFDALADESSAGLLLVGGS